MKIVFALLVLSVLSACGGVKVGPFIPDNPQRCKADPDCKPGFYCTFPGIGYPKTCMPFPGPGDDAVMLPVQ